MPAGAGEIKSFGELIFPENPASRQAESDRSRPLPAVAIGAYSVVREVGIRLRETGAVGSCVEFSALRCSLVLWW
jgi:hypothetical protein